MERLLSDLQQSESDRKTCNIAIVRWWHFATLLREWWHNCNTAKGVIVQSVTLPREWWHNFQHCQGEWWHNFQHCQEEGWHNFWHGQGSDGTIFDMIKGVMAQFLTWSREWWHNLRHWQGSDGTIWEWWHNFWHGQGSDGTICDIAKGVTVQFESDGTICNNNAKGVMA